MLNMKKTISVMFITLFSLIFCSSCSDFPFVMVEYVDAQFYGVAEYIDYDEDGVEDLVLNIPPIGYVEIPDIDNIYYDVGDEYYKDYVIQENDFVFVWFQKIDDADIIETYPAKFQNDPSNITINHQNVKLENTEDGWIFNFPVTSEISFVDSSMSELEINDSLYVYRLNYLDEYVVIATTTIQALTQETLQILIMEDEILDFFYYYNYNQIYISNNEISNNVTTTNTDT